MYLFLQGLNKTEIEAIKNSSLPFSFSLKYLSTYGLSLTEKKQVMSNGPRKRFHMCVSVRLNFKDEV